MPITETVESFGLPVKPVTIRKKRKKKNTQKDKPKRIQKILPRKPGETGYEDPEE